MGVLHIVLTCDGGNGHKAAAESIRVKAIDNHEEVIVINTTREAWFSDWFCDVAPRSVMLWDWAQRTSQIELLCFFASLRAWSDFMYSKSFKNKSDYLLTGFANNDTYSDVFLHNTQPNNLYVLVHSVAQYNREIKAYNLENPEASRSLVKYVNHFTDMPTPDAKMFIEEIQKIDIDDLNDSQFELRTKSPCLPDEENMLSDEERLTNYHHVLKQLYPVLYQDLAVGASRVTFIDGPIRNGFIQRKNNPAKRDELTINFLNEAEFNDLREITGHLFSDFCTKMSHASLHIEENIDVVTIMLGSQASIDGTLLLVNHEIACTDNQSNTKYVFVFCGENKPEKGFVLYSKVLDIAKRVNMDVNSRIKIIPLTNQSDQMIADVYSFADRVIIRPGGISIMEIEAVVKKGDIFIFTELGKLPKFFNAITGRSKFFLEQQFSQQESNTRFSDLVAWERGNGLHAQQKCIDESGRTRVVAMNEYTFRKELLLLAKKKKIIRLINECDYIGAVNEFKINSELNAFFKTGHDAGVELSCLVDFMQLCARIHQQLSDLNGFNDRYNLFTLLNTHDINEQLKQKELPSTVLKTALKNVCEIKKVLETMIGEEKSSFKQKSGFIQVLESLYKAVVDFYRYILGLKPTMNSVDVFKKSYDDIKLTSDIIEHTMSKRLG